MGTIKLPELKQYVLRQLGHPILRVEVASAQLDDCVDEALKTFYECHYDAVDAGYIAVSVSAGTQSYTLSESVLEVLECLNIENLSSSATWIDDEPLLLMRPTTLAEPCDYYDMVSVEVYRQRMQLIDDMYKTTVLFEFNSMSKRLTFPETPSGTGTRILKILQKSDAHLTNQTVDSLWLKKYATALTRIQWGVNLSKYEGAQLPGGVSINAAGILQKGEDDKEKLLIELDDKYTEPPDPVFA
jgi:hypothetical protein